MSKYTLFALALTLVLGGAGFAGNALAAEPEKTDAFVCPVIKTDNVLNSPKGAELGIEGYYTIGPSGGAAALSVPVHATNGEGTAAPGGPFSAPGDTDYTAIWAVQEEE